uniref:NADH-ubiquinone oxidoreductase chain 2 n=2 Tax=Orseolia oryzae TaxID=33408 RepID=A0A0K0M782_9DIPT|nr:NADH dehydrogenase subunit 2 [Orseolia oryzae]
MFKKNFNMFFLMLTIFSSFFLISSKSWLIMWIWLEMNLISFIAFTIDKKNILSIESSLIYFLIQSIASIMLMFSIIMINFIFNFIFLFMISILIKLGSAPFHFWFPFMIEGLSWNKIFIFLTFQKINPIYMINLNNFQLYLTMFIMFSMMIGSISGLNFSSLKKIMTYSSISQLSWLMISLMNNKLMKIYLMFYFFMMFLILKSFEMFNLKFINQLFNLNMNKFNKLFLFMNLLSLGGLPPFLGFFPKLLIINKFNSYFMIFFLIIFSLLSLFMYLRIIFSMMMLNSMKINKFKIINNFKFIKMLMNLSIINNFLLIIFFLL